MTGNFTNFLIFPLKCYFYSLSVPDFLISSIIIIYYYFSIFLKLPSMGEKKKEKKEGGMKGSRLGVVYHHILKYEYFSGENGIYFLKLPLHIILEIGYKKLPF